MKALEDGESIAQLSPAVDSRDHLEARLFLSQKKWAEAAIVLGTLHKKNPSSVSVATDLVRALVYSGRREEALSVLGHVLSKETRPEQKAKLARRTRVISRLFLTNESFQQYQQGLQVMGEGKFRSAREKFERVLKAEPDNVEVLTRTGQCLLLEKDEDSAAERLRFARRLNPFEPQLRLWLGRALHERGEAQEALVELKSAYQELKGFPSAARWYAEALDSAGMRSQALRILEEEANRFPSRVETLISLARLRIGPNGSNVAGAKDPQALWAARKDLQIALSRLRQIEESAPSSSGLEFEIQLTREQLGQEISKLLEQVDSRLNADRSA